MRFSSFNVTPLLSALMMQVQCIKKGETHPATSKNTSSTRQGGVTPPCLTDEGVAPSCRAEERFSMWKATTIRNMRWQHTTTLLLARFGAKKSQFAKETSRSSGVLDGDSDSVDSR